MVMPLLLRVLHLVQYVQGKIMGLIIVPTESGSESNWNLLWNTGLDCVPISLAYSEDCCCPSPCALCEDCLVRITFYDIVDCEKIPPVPSCAGALNGQSFILANVGGRMWGDTPNYQVLFNCPGGPLRAALAAWTAFEGCGCFIQTWGPNERCCNVDNYIDVCILYLFNYLFSIL